MLLLYSKMCISPNALKILQRSDILQNDITQINNIIKNTSVHFVGIEIK